MLEKKQAEQYCEHSQGEKQDEQADEHWKRQGQAELGFDDCFES